MGEAMPESLRFPHAKARALLEVVRLAFEGGIGFGSEALDGNSPAATEDGNLLSGPASSSRQKPRGSKEHTQQLQMHAPHRPAGAGSSSRLVPGGPCMWCDVTATPQWRRPRGTNKLLCNACGIFFTRYGRLPERSQHLHSSAPDATAGAKMSMASPVAELGIGDGVYEHAVSQQEQPSHDSAKTEADSTGPAGSVRLLQAGQAQQQIASPATGIIPHKRKDAPQPEAELLYGSDDGTNGASGENPEPQGTVRIAMASPSPCISPQRPSPVPDNPPDQKVVPKPAVTAPGAEADGCPMAALLKAGAGQTSTVLTVAPLDLGVLQQMALQRMELQLGQPLGCLATLPPLCLTGSVTAAPSGSATSCTTACGTAATTATAASGNRSPAAVTVLPPQLLGRVFALPGGLLPAGVALLDAATAAAIQAPPRPLYARPSKRQERLPSGDSEDSNVSTDSHTGPHGEAGTSHDEDDGGTTTTITTTANNSSAHALGCPSSSPPSLPSLHLPSALLGRPVTVPRLTGPTSTLAVAPGGPGIGPVVAAGLTTGFAAAGCVAVAGIVPTGGQCSAEQQGQPQQQVIFLPTRRSKGPRSRASSTTPSSSTHS